MAAIVQAELEVVKSPSTTDAVIRVEDVHKYYDLGETKVHALRGVSLAIGRGEFVAIMGSAAASQLS